MLGAHLHQVFELEFIDEHGALLAAIADLAPHDQEQARTELSSLLARDISSDALAKILLHELGCYFDPRSIGLTPRQWLAQVQNDLAD